MLAGTLTRVPSSLGELLPPDLAARLDRLDVLSRKVLAGKLQGERRSKRRGRSVEFDDYREYVPGDDLRHIDWNVFARLDRFFIKVFQEEEDLSLHILLDASPSMNAGGGRDLAGNKLLFAARLAAALGYVGLVNNNRVRLSVFGAGGLRRLEPIRGRRNTQRLTQFILQHAFAAAATTAGAPDAEAGPTFSGALRSIAAADAGAGKGVLVLLSDLLIPGDGYQPGLSALAAAAGPVDAFCFQILSAGELDPAADGVGRSPTGAAAPGADDETPRSFLGDLRLTDAETGAAAEVTVTGPLLEQYRRTVRAYVEDAHRFCHARGVHHALVPSSTAVAPFLLETLRRLGVLK